MSVHLFDRTVSTGVSAGGHTLWGSYQAWGTKMTERTMKNNDPCYCASYRQFVPRHWWNKASDEVNLAEDHHIRKVVFVVRKSVKHWFDMNMHGAIAVPTYCIVLSIAATRKFNWCWFNAGPRSTRWPNIRPAPGKRLVITEIETTFTQELNVCAIMRAHALQASLARWGRWLSLAAISRNNGR